jgi:peptidase S41-like protein/tricorn protease-like protein
MGRRFLARSILFLVTLFLGISVQAKALDGLWLSDDNNMLFDVKGDAVRAFEITSISCRPAWQITGNTNQNFGGGIIFTQNACMRHLVPDALPDAARLQSDCSVAGILLWRVPQPPNSYGKPSDNVPLANYAIFWQTFAENYPFFELHHVDWAAMDREFRPQVTATTSPDELFHIFCKMIEPLHDAHTSLNAPDLKQQYRGHRPEVNQLRYDDWVRSAVIVASKYVHGEMQYFCKNQISFGMLDGSIGYLKIWSFANYVDEPDYAKQFQALEAALDAVFHDSGKLQGLVIDVRLNTGGYDGLGLCIASRLAGEDYLAYAVETRDNIDGPLHFTRPQRVHVHASMRPGFHRNVVVLIGHDCASAGETFTMALLGRRPAVIRIGESTQGVFSDILTRKLPNGWLFGLPNEIYLTEDGKSFDGLGVPPDISAPIFPREDLQKDHDSALEKAAEVLGKQHW